MSCALERIPVFPECIVQPRGKCESGFSPLPSLTVGSLFRVKAPHVQNPTLCMIRIKFSYERRRCDPAHRSQCSVGQRVTSPQGYLCEYFFHVLVLPLVCLLRSRRFLGRQLLPVRHVVIFRRPRPVKKPTLRSEVRRGGRERKEEETSKRTSCIAFLNRINLNSFVLFDYFYPFYMNSFKRHQNGPLSGPKNV